MIDTTNLKDGRDWVLKPDLTVTDLMLLKGTIWGIIDQLTLTIEMYTTLENLPSNYPDKYKKRKNKIKRNIKDWKTRITEIETRIESIGAPAHV